MNKITLNSTPPLEPWESLQRGKIIIQKDTGETAILSSGPQEFPMPFVEAVYLSGGTPMRLLRRNYEAHWLVFHGTVTLTTK